MKKETAKILRKISRKRLPVLSLKAKAQPSRKRKLSEKILNKETSNAHKTNIF